MLKLKFFFLSLVFGLSALGEIQKPCASRGGEAYPTEGSGSCRGNLSLTITLPTTDLSLVYNSQSKLNLGYGVGWSLSAEAFFEKISAQQGFLQLGNGTRIEFKFDGASWRAKYPVTYENTFTESQPSVMFETELDGSGASYRKYGNRYLITSIGSRKGTHQTFVRTSSGILSGIKNFFGQLNPLSFASTGLLATLKDYKGGTYSFLYDNQGKLLKVTYPNLETVEMSYLNGTGLIQSHKDRKGRVTTFAYYIYGSDSAIKSVKDFEGIVTSYFYTLNSVEVKEFIRNKKETFLRQNGATQIQAVENGVNSRFQYDDQMRLVQSVDHFDLSTSYVFQGGNPFPSSVQHPDGTNASYIYDANNRVVEETFSGGGQSLVTKYTRNGYGEVTEVKTANLVQKYTYDSKGNVLSIIDPTNTVALANSYTSTSLLATTTDSEGDKWTFTYDALGNQSQVTHPSGESVSATYDLLGEKLSLLKMNSNSSSVGNYAYDAMGRATFASEEVAGAEGKLKLISTSQYTPDSESHSSKYDLNGVLFKQMNLKLDAKNRPVLIEESLAK